MATDTCGCKVGNAYGLVGLSNMKRFSVDVLFTGCRPNVQIQDRLIERTHCEDPVKDQLFHTGQDTSETKVQQSMIRPIWVRKTESEGDTS